jgi:hypothetical protein
VQKWFSLKSEFSLNSCIAIATCFCGRRPAPLLCFVVEAMLRAEEFLISFVVAEARAEAGFLGACGLSLRDERTLPKTRAK